MSLKLTQSKLSTSHRGGPGSILRPIFVGYLADKVPMRQVVLVFRCLNTTPIIRTSGRSLDTFKQSNVFPMSGSIGQKHDWRLLDCHASSFLIGIQRFWTLPNSPEFLNQYLDSGASQHSYMDRNVLSGCFCFCLAVARLMNLLRGKTQQFERQLWAQTVSVQGSNRECTGLKL